MIYMWVHERIQQHEGRHKRTYQYNQNHTIRIPEVSRHETQRR